MMIVTKRAEEERFTQNYDRAIALYTLLTIFFSNSIFYGV